MPRCDSFRALDAHTVGFTAPGEFRSETSGGCGWPHWESNPDARFSSSFSPVHPHPPPSPKLEFFWISCPPPCIGIRCNARGLASKLASGLALTYESLPVFCWLLPCSAPAAPSMSSTNTTSSSRVKASSEGIAPDRPDRPGQARGAGQRGEPLWALPNTAQAIRHCASIDDRTNAPGRPLRRATDLACSDALSNRVPLITIAHAQMTRS